MTSYTGEIPGSLTIIDRQSVVELLPQIMNPDYLDYRRQQLAEQVIPQMSRKDYRNILARADNPALDATEQIRERFDGDQETIELNMLLLCGLAVKKDMEYRRAGIPTELQEPFMGEPVEHIVKNTLQELRLSPLTKKKIRQLGGMKQFAGWVFYRVLYRGNESDELLHPKLAYWWSGRGHWTEPHTRSTDFMNFLDTFRENSTRSMVVNEIDLFLRDLQRRIHVR